MTVCLPHSAFSDLDPLALLVVPVVTCASDGLAMQAVGALLIP
jgi:hypothetical protein